MNNSKLSNKKYSFKVLAIVAVAGIVIGAIGALSWFYEPNYVVDLSQAKLGESIVSTLDTEGEVPTINAVGVNDRVKRTKRDSMGGLSTRLCTTNVCFKRVGDKNNPNSGSCITKKIIIQCR